MEDVVTIIDRILKQSWHLLNVITWRDHAKNFYISTQATKMPGRGTHATVREGLETLISATSVRISKKFLFLNEATKSMLVIFHMQTW